MRSTFNLKESKKDGLTSIRFIAYFKSENKKFVYSTGEVIHPEDWDFEMRQPKYLNGRTKKADQLRSIKFQLDRYSNLLVDLSNRFKVINHDITIDLIRKEFDQNFKRVKPISNRFFDVYDLFLKYKKEDKSGDANSVTTIKRYTYNRKLLMDFQEHSNKKIHFNAINEEFYKGFINYCVLVKKHSVNTLSRNVGLFKTYMYWAYNNNHTYKDDFKQFKNIKKEITEEIALTLDQIKEVFDYDFTNNKRLEKVRDLFVFGCATGMRFSNYSIIKKSDIYSNHIHVRDKKNSDKLLVIPLNDFSKSILEKYEYNLPLISNQNFNDYIKDVFEKIGYNENIKRTSKIGNKVVEKILPLYKRISSHTARRSFISIMKTKKIPDKVIMSWTGHRSLETFNRYYKPNEDEKVDFMNSVWNID